MNQSKIIIALDYSNQADALSLVDQLDPALCKLKVGKELFTAAGPELVKKLVDKKFAVFLDLKFHDIPNTVAKAVSVAADLGVWMVNVHASGGRSMMEAAHKALLSYGQDKPLLTAVTVLTSLSDSDLNEVGISHSAKQQVSSLAALAESCGLDGVVCSAQEASDLKKERKKDFILVTPGIRPASITQGAGYKDDQQRIVTPVQAIANGSDYLVIGRPITQAKNPLDVLQELIQELA